MAGGWPVFDFSLSDSLYLFGEDIKFQKKIYCVASLAGAVIQAIGRPEFEDGLRTGVLLQDC